MIFVDSSFWIAQMVGRDGRRDAAVALQGVYDVGRLVTSLAVAACYERPEPHARAVCKEQAQHAAERCQEPFRSRKVAPAGRGRTPTAANEGSQFPRPSFLILDSRRVSHPTCQT